MKISVDDKELFTLSETQKKVIKNDISEDIFYDDMCRRLNYILIHKYEQCLQRLKNDWIPKLKAKGIKSIPMDDYELAELIFSQNDYMDRKAKDNLI